MTLETKLILLAAFLGVLTAATCSRTDGRWDDTSVKCAESGHRWTAPSWISPGWCDK